ncbi:hypothetical protein [Rhodoferax sp.]|uniref:hypothetical protein n=1 Tax=Rhodoferax sp. TaxID=50421 RepID=UPI0027214977|nr:hypothetical protein [Rhodoferax sp.]MDO8317758.1 hypothetical protein [Rhodoferax sp.]MDP2695248.1 hypothetical protein [Gallionella sp.]
MQNATDSPQFGVSGLKQAVWIALLPSSVFLRHSSSMIECPQWSSPGTSGSEIITTLPTFPRTAERAVRSNLIEKLCDRNGSAANRCGLLKSVAEEFGTFHLNGSETPSGLSSRTKYQEFTGI